MTDQPFSRRGFVAGAGAMLATNGARAADRAVDDGLFVTLNGTPQWVAVRGRRASNPVLLVLGGGPGVPTSFMAPVFDDWADDFTVVLWDQPGSGGTFLKNGGEAGIGEVSVDRYAADGLALADHVAHRFAGRKIVLLGYSWGSMVGLTMAARRPKRFAAYVGTGQAIDTRRADALSYRLVLEDARGRGDAAAVSALEKLGPPPYDVDQRLIKQGYATAMTALERTNAVRIGPLLAPSGAGSWIWPQALGPYDARGAFLGTVRRGYADAQRWAAAPLGRRFDLPMFFFQGEQDRSSVTALVEEYVEALEAPSKTLELIAGAGHGTIPFCCAELKTLIERRLRPILA